MSELMIGIPEGRTGFRPGETVSGTVSWSVAGPPAIAALTLGWQTRGKGDTDSDVVKKILFDQPRAVDERAFSITLPEGPYSFSGRLISLIWSLELEVGEHARRLEIVVSPTGREVELKSIS